MGEKGFSSRDVCAKQILTYSYFVRSGKAYLPFVLFLCLNINGISHLQHLHVIMLCNISDSILSITL